MTLNKTKIRSFIVGHINSLDSTSVPLEEDLDYNLIQEGYVDSLGFIDLLEAIENQLGLEIDLSEADPEIFTTLSGLIDTLSPER